MPNTYRIFRTAAALPLAALITLLSLVIMQPAHAQVCPFDDGNSSIAVEGLILTRYALGITGAPLVASTDINAVDAPTVEATINCPSCGLNITGNPTMTVADATIISRKLAGMSGAALTDGLNLGSGTRNTPAAVNSFLLAGCGATGGTVTSITAGSGLTGGIITGSGTIAADTTFLQRRVSTSCAVGSSIRAIAADGTVTCQTDATGGSGTVISVSAGTGLTGGTFTTTGTIAADTAFLQRRVALPCAAGSFITAIAADGTATCGAPPAGGSGTVTSVAMGSGLTGPTITSAGTVALANTFKLPQGCSTGQVPKFNSGAGVWNCQTDIVGTGTVTAVSATAPLASSGGTTPAISLTGTIPVVSGGTGRNTLAANGVVIGQGASAVATAVGGSGQVLTGTAGLPTWTGAPTLSGPLTVLTDVKLGNGGQFFATGGEENLRIVRGLVVGPGTISAGTGFTVARTPGGFPIGDFTVVYSRAFTDTPSVTFTAVDSNDVSVRLIATNPILFRVQTVLTGFGLLDRDWNFIAVGSR